MKWNEVTRQCPHHYDTAQILEKLQSGHTFFVALASSELQSERSVETKNQ